MIHSTDDSRFASSNTTTGAFPPSSRWTLFSVSAAARATSFPVVTSPVTETIPTPGCLTSAAPVGTPSPVITLNTPAGKMSAASSATRSNDRGVHSDGLITTVFPAARAGPNFQMAIHSG